MASKPVEVTIMTQLRESGVGGKGTAGRKDREGKK